MREEADLMGHQVETLHPVEDQTCLGGGDAIGQETQTDQGGGWRDYAVAHMEHEPDYGLVVDGGNTAFRDE